MAYRDFTLPDGRVVRTRISDEGTLEWFRDRVALERKGYPDRPPDFDNETTRMWCGPKEVAESPSHMVSSYPVGYYVLNMGKGLPTVKVMVSSLSPGDGYLLRVKMESGIPDTIGDNLGDFETFFQYGQEEALNYAIEHALRGLSELETVLGPLISGAVWLITAPGDVTDLDSETEKAAKEYKQEYGDTEANHPYWQRFREPIQGSRSEGTVH